MPNMTTSAQINNCKHPLESLKYFKGSPYAYICDDCDAVVAGGIGPMLETLLLKVQTELAELRLEIQEFRNLG